MQQLKDQMKLLLRGSDKDKNNIIFKAEDNWLNKFTKRKGVFKQRKTNGKILSFAERLSQIKNFHWYSIYQMATEDP